MKEAEYFELVHKKHKRGIYFRDTPEAIRFIKSRFRHSFKERLIYFLITLGVHRLASKRVILPSKFGEVIYVANSIKSFDLKNKCVYTFIEDKEELIDKIRTLNVLARNGFAPKVLGVSDKGYYKEELLYNHKLSDDAIFKKLMEFYDWSNHKLIHGDFMRDHIKVNGDGEIRFIDWNIREGNSIEDARTFMRYSK